MDKTHVRSMKDTFSYSLGWDNPKLRFAGIFAFATFAMFEAYSSLGLLKPLWQALYFLFALPVLFILIYGLIKNFSRRNLAGIYLVVFFGGFVFGMLEALFSTTLERMFGLSEELQMILILVLGVATLCAPYLYWMRKKGKTTA